VFSDRFEHFRRKRVVKLIVVSENAE
jgi:hypothetical protein